VHAAVVELDTLRSGSATTENEYLLFLSLAREASGHYMKSNSKGVFLADTG
jgi:hypothetical protein